MSGENILKGCLVESDPEKIARARRTKRRALIAAAILQVLLVGLLALAPLLGAVEKLPRTVMIDGTPIPPYPRGPQETNPKTKQPPAGHKKLHVTNQRPIYQPPRIPAEVQEVKDPDEAIKGWEKANREGPDIGARDGIAGMDIFDPNARTTIAPKPAEPERKSKPRPVVSEGVQAARLIYRVEPQYPSLARNARMEGKVVLRAVIAKDGTMQSLEVVSGSALFVRAVREAILQWRYQPTLLHGEPVEVETLITVVFTLKR